MLFYSRFKDEDNDNLEEEKNNLKFEDIDTEQDAEQNDEITEEESI